jgi:hypothetical protein
MEHGAIIMDSFEAAASAGIERYDIIKKVDGLEIKGVDDFIDFMGTKKIGEQINVEVLRKNQTIFFKPVLSKRSGYFSQRFVLGGNNKPDGIIVGTQNWLTVGEEKKQLMKGFEEALSIMKMGYKASFIFPSDLAFGENWIGDVPPNSQLFVEIDLPRQFRSVRDSKDFLKALNAFINTYDRNINIDVRYL